MDSSKKFNQTKDDDPSPIGNLVHWYIKEKNIKKNEVSKKLGITGITLNQYFKQKSIQTIILWRMAKSIQFNFFGFLSEKINIPYTTQKEKDLQTQLEKQQQENQDLKKENNLLRELLKR